MRCLCAFTSKWVWEILCLLSRWSFLISLLFSSNKRSKIEFLVPRSHFFLSEKMLECLCLILFSLIPLLLDCFPSSQIMFARLHASAAVQYSCSNSDDASYFFTDSDLCLENNKDPALKLGMDTILFLSSDAPFSQRKSSCYVRFTTSSWAQGQAVGNIHISFLDFIKVIFFLVCQPTNNVQINRECRYFKV